MSISLFYLCALYYHNPYKSVIKQGMFSFYIHVDEDHYSNSYTVLS